MPKEIMNHSPRKERTIGLDILRGVGTVVVLVAHLLLSVPHDLHFQIPGLTWRTVYFGNWLLECFFAMSGFLIGGPLLHYAAFDRVSVRNYAIDRATRILPCYYFVFFALTLAHFVLFGERAIYWSYLVFLQCYTDHLLFLGVAWTLSVEVASYILLPIFIWLFRFRIRVVDNVYGNIILFSLVWILLETVARVVTISLAPDLPMDGGIRKQTHLRLDALFYGLIVACIKDGYPALFRRMSSGLFFLAALAGLLLVSERQYVDLFIRNLPGEAHRRLHVLVDFTATGCLAACLLPFCTRISMSMFRAACLQRLVGFFVYIAKISYSLYLIHFLLVPLFLRLYYWLVTTHTVINHISFLVISAAYLLTCLFVADRLFHYVEIPGMRLRKRLKKNA